MVSRTSAEPQGRPNKFTDVGVMGRKTGLMIKDTGRRDSAGLEDMDDFFSPTAEKSPRRTKLAPAAPILSYKTRQQALTSDEPVSMSGTSSSIRDPKEVLASRKSLLAPHRSPQKTHLKSPAVRVQTPKANKLDSPSRVKRLLSFTDLEVESFEEDNVPPGKNRDVDVIESPSEMARSTKGKGLAQRKVKKPVFSMAADDSPDDEDTIAESIEGEGFGEGDFGPVGGLGVDEEEGVEQEDLPMEEEEEQEEVVEEEQEVEEASSLPQLTKRGRGRPRHAASKTTTTTTKNPTGRPKAKASSAQPASKRPRMTTTSPKIKIRKEIPHAADITMDDDAIRKSTRIRVPPLAHWKNERIVYELEGRRQSGPAMLRIKEIVRVDTPPRPPRAKPTTTTTNPRKRKTSAAEDDSDVDMEDDYGEVKTTIKAFGDDTAEIEDYRVAVAGRGIETRPVQGNKVRMAKIFQDGDYMASGVLDILVGGDKTVKPTKHSYMSFVVLWGKVEVKIHRAVFRVSRGGLFVVPRGNFYSIKNIGTKDCRLFFSQAVETSDAPNQNA